MGSEAELSARLKTFFGGAFGSLAAWRVILASGCWWTCKYLTFALPSKHLLREALQSILLPIIGSECSTSINKHHCLFGMSSINFQSYRNVCISSHVGKVADTWGNSTWNLFSRKHPATECETSLAPAGVWTLIAATLKGAYLVQRWWWGGQCHALIYSDTHEWTLLCTQSSQTAWEGESQVNDSQIWKHWKWWNFLFIPPICWTRQHLPFSQDRQRPMSDRLLRQKCKETFIKRLILIKSNLTAAPIYSSRSSEGEDVQAGLPTFDPTYIPVVPFHLIPL